MRRVKNVILLKDKLYGVFLFHHTAVFILNIPTSRLLLIFVLKPQQIQFTTVKPV